MGAGSRAGRALCPASVARDGPNRGGPEGCVLVFVALAEEGHLRRESRAAGCREPAPMERCRCCAHHPACSACSASSRGWRTGCAPWHATKGRLVCQTAAHFRRRARSGAPARLAYAGFRTSSRQGHITKLPKPLWECLVEHFAARPEGQSRAEYRIVNALLCRRAERP